MDPLTIISSALIAGAAAAVQEVAGQVVKEGYAALKTLVVRKFGEKAEIEDALESVEKKPDSAARQGVLREELEAAEAQRDAEIVQQAEGFLKRLKEQGVVSETTYQAIVEGSGAIALGPGAVAAGEGGVAVGGSVEGGIHIGDRRPPGDPTTEPPPPERNDTI